MEPRVSEEWGGDGEEARSEVDSAELGTDIHGVSVAN